MDQRATSSTRLLPLPPEHSPELNEQFEAMRKNLGFIPNSILIMQRKPKLAKALAQMDGSRLGSRGQGRSWLQAHHRARREPCGRMPILHGPHRQRRASLRRRRQKARRGVGVPDEPALQCGRACDVGFCNRGRLCAQRSYRCDVCRSAQILDGRADRRDRWRDLAIRFPQPMERHARHTARR